MNWYKLAQSTEAIKQFIQQNKNQLPYDVDDLINVIEGRRNAIIFSLWMANDPEEAKEEARPMHHVLQELVNMIIQQIPQMQIKSVYAQEPDGPVHEELAVGTMDGVNQIVEAFKMKLTQGATKEYHYMLGGALGHNEQNADEWMQQYPDVINPITEQTELTEQAELIVTDIKTGQKETIL